MRLPDIQSVEDAAAVIQPFIHRTPVVTSQSINDRSGCEVFFKCENFQRTGAFKMRGASYAMASIDQSQNISGVITHSSGNHAAAVACAAQQYGFTCEIIMPKDAPQVKQAAVRHYAANITLCEPGMQAREDTTAELMAKRPDLKLVHPYDDFHVISGQGTAMLEFLEQVQDVDTMILPIGGGGLISGASIAIQARSPQTRLVGVEPDVVDEARRSVADHQRYPATGGKTIADGLQAGIGELNFTLIQQGVRELVSVTEQQIKAALRLVLERLKVVIEPSAAVPLAALLSGQIDPGTGRVGIILTGGNIELDGMNKLI